MSRRVDEFFNKSNFSEGIRLINEGEYATFDFESSYQAIIETQPEEIKKRFFELLEKYNSKINDFRFIQLTFDDVYDYVKNEIMKDSGRNKSKKVYKPEEIIKLFEDCKIYGHRESLEVCPNGEIFIFRIPSEEEFELAKSYVKDVLEQYYLRYKNLEPTKQLQNVFICIREKDGFFDIEIEDNKINDRAWIGIDLR